MSLFCIKNVDYMICMGYSNMGLKKVFGFFDLIFLGVGVIIGIGIFVLIGIGVFIVGLVLMLFFIFVVFVCGFVVLCYVEFVLIIFVLGFIYMYVYVMMGELVVWIIGWDLMFEYGLVIFVVLVGWFGYF